MSGRDHCPICDATLGPPTIHAPDRLHGTPGEHGVAICASCGAGVTFPNVDDRELAGFYPTGYSAYDDTMSALARIVSRAIRGYQGWAAVRGAPLVALADRAPGRGLDVGCGRGDLAVVLAGHGWAMTGIEPSADAAAVAASRGIDARCGTLSTVALEPGSYDAIVFRHSLEHINDPVADLRTAAAALAPDGLVLITVPNFGGWQARRFGGRWYHLDLPRHRVHFSSSSLRRALRSAGLEVVSVSTSSSSMGLPASVQYRLFGRCLFPTGLGLRIALGLCTLSMPLTRVLDRGAGDGDLLHVVGRRSLWSSLDTELGAHRSALGQ